MGRRAVPGLAAGALALLLFLSCRQIVGIEGHPPGGVDASTSDGPAEVSASCGAFAWSAGDCASCMLGSCCDKASACREDSVCSNAFDCMTKCSGDDDACRSKCILVSSEKDDTMADLASCQAASCDGPCGLRCGGYEAYFGGPPAPPDGGAPDPCQACLASEATCTLLGQFAATPAALEDEFCHARCSGVFDVICVANCDIEYPIASLGPDAGLLGALNGDCESACPSGTDWTCLGDVHWPRPTTAPVTFRLKPTSLTDTKGSPLLDAQVRVCSQNDLECGGDAGVAPLLPDPTTGIVTVMLSALPFSGYFEVSAPGFVTTLYIFTPSIAEGLDPGAPAAGVQLVSTGVFPSMVAAAGATLSTSLGYLYVAPYDCVAQPAPGVSFAGTNLGSAVPYYMVDGTPSAHANATSYGPMVGGGFADIAPGLVTMTASVGGTAYATLGLPIRANAFTIVSLVPTETAAP